MIGKDEHVGGGGGGGAGGGGEEEEVSMIVLFYWAVEEELHSACCWHPGLLIATRLKVWMLNPWVRCVIYIRACTPTVYDDAHYRYHYLSPLCC